MRTDLDSNAPGVLTGIKVLDFTHIFSGPQTTQILGDLGADVIKVERVDGGDPARRYGQGVDDEGMGGSFVALNRNKRSIAVDVASDDGREIVRRLVAECDVLVQNFKTGQMARWGLDYDTVHELNPRIVYCSISGFGSEGPLAKRAANDLVIQAYSGLLSFTGEPGGGPVRVGTAVADLTAGTNAALGILAALFQRERTGLGQEITTSMLEGMVSMMNYFFVDYWLKGIVPQPLGTANRLGIPNQAFPTADGWIVISNANEPMWVRCCEALGIAELAHDPRFDSLAHRYEHTSELVEAVTEATRRLRTEEALRRLGAASVSCGPINDLPTVADDPQLDALGMFFDVPVGAGTERVVGSAFSLRDAPLVARRGVPEVGQHTDEVLDEIGYDEERIARLRREGIIG
ncbi:CoA transferase [Microbacterium pseudoresistens]|uniref:Crotonobetainyl-CoA:carnitine CoA-transferase CaiB-like acyl-CoA transferase n=1 Tax=Microbacterium pseudoresistens TaxID=640634 RepID=A0A7Y9EUQ3_9MICO|nr:crotonobetainyl-CoA:carnitine CoA-transferase CaiB-like acyl-CoA transferase [Microbacterium pseudoresistens]